MATMHLALTSFVVLMLFTPTTYSLTNNAYPLDVTPQEFLATHPNVISLSKYKVELQPNGHAVFLVNVTTEFQGYEPRQAAIVILLDNATSTAFNFFYLRDEYVPVYDNYTEMKEKTPAGVGFGFESFYNTTFSAIYPFSVGINYMYQDSPYCFRFVIYYEGTTTATTDILLVIDEGNFLGTHDSVSTSFSSITPFLMLWPSIFFTGVITRNRKQQSMHV